MAEKVGILSFMPDEEEATIFSMRWRTAVLAGRSPVFVLALLMINSPCGRAGSGSPAEEAFRKIQSLAGKWEGMDAEGKLVKSEFVPIAGKTAVMETLAMPGMDEDMVTLYSVDIDAVALAHYCPTNNQPRMRAAVSTLPVRELVFVFSGAGNLPDKNTGHEHKMVLQFTDQDHMTERWTRRRNGSDTEMVLRMTRIESRGK